MWGHSVKLRWEGFIEMRGNRIVRLLLWAEGNEKLNWGNAAFGIAANDKNDVARLPAGHFFDLACEVHYGLIGTPPPEDAVSQKPAPAAANAPPGPMPNQPPDGAHILMMMVGPQFAVLLPTVQDDLKLSQPQRQSLNQLNAGMSQGLQQRMQGLERASPQEREGVLNQFREGANKQIGEMLSKLLTGEQQARLRQIVLQQQGLFALGDPDIAARLKLTDAQRGQFMRVIQEMQQRMEALQQKAQSGQVQSIPQEASRIRKEQEARIEDLLTTDQKQAWKAMLGKPLPL